MIKEALQYIVGLKEAKLLEIHGDTYSSKSLECIGKYIPRAAAIEMNTLTSLIDYIKSKVDTMSEKMIIQVVSPTEVELYSALDSDRKREKLVKVEAMLPEFRFNSFVEKESFVIGLQSKFLDDPNTDKALVLKFAGTVENKTVAEYGDDGVTQKASVKTGIASKSDAIVPNPVKLKPFRTFLEVQQPASRFIFRLKDTKYEGIECAIFEADGGAWKNEAMQNIKSYLADELSEYSEQFTIIS